MCGKKTEKAMIAINEIGYQKCKIAETVSSK